MSNLQGRPVNIQDRIRQIIKEALCLSSTGISYTKIPQIAELTDGFSFAYLQELFFSSMDLWMETQTPGEMDRIMISQVSELKEQISLSDEGETNKKEKVNQFLSLFKMLSQEE